MKRRTYALIADRSKQELALVAEFFDIPGPLVLLARCDQRIEEQQDLQ